VLEVANGGPQPARFSLSWVRAKMDALQPLGAALVMVPELPPYAAAPVRIQVRKAHIQTQGYRYSHRRSHSHRRPGTQTPRHACTEQRPPGGPGVRPHVC
jgi:hypothetical protein